MEGLKFKGFHGEVEMRKTDHQLQQAAVHREWRKADAEEPVQRREHRLQLPGGEGDSGLRGEHADLVPDEASLTAPSSDAARRGARDGARAVASLLCADATSMDLYFLISLLNGLSRRAAAVHAGLGPDADLQHDGRARTSRTPASTCWAPTSPTRSPQVVGFWWALVLAPPIVGAAGRAVRALLRCAACTSSATCPSC